MTILLVAGVGNIFAGDHAFGVEVAKRLSVEVLPEGASVASFGSRALDLACALLDGCDAAVLISATSRGGTPGTLYLTRPESGPSAMTELHPSHELDPNTMLQMLGGARGRCRRLLIVGCELQTLEEQSGGAMGLSAPVAAAVDRAVELVKLVAMSILN